MWKEGKREEEGVVPTNWIDDDCKILCWPKVSNAEKLLKQGAEPRASWWRFPIINIKFTSGKANECTMLFNKNISLKLVRLF